jgi:hypothetical protein
MNSKQLSDAPQNLGQFVRWRGQKQAFNCDDHYLSQVNRKWRTLGRLARQPASAALRRGRPIG